MIKTNYKGLSKREKKVWWDSMDKFMRAGQKQTELFKTMVGPGRAIEPAEKGK